VSAVTAAEVAGTKPRTAARQAAFSQGSVRLCERQGQNASAGVDEYVKEGFEDDFGKNDKARMG
jgi:hypothetical protein